jgi:xanthine dehydrogenase accessory factor
MDMPVVIPAPVYADYVLDALLAWRREGRRMALLTLVRVDGQSPRPVGSQMAVCEDGRSLGALTGGCVERALVLDALAAMARGENHIELYGRGSRYKDIELPCGSGIHVHFDVTLADDDLEALVAARARRRPAWLVIDETTQRAKASLQAPAASAGSVVLPFVPQCRLVLAGQGGVTLSAAPLAAALEMAVEVYTPDRAVAAQLAGPKVFALSSASDFRPVLDPWTAVAATFHDHGFETEILMHALESSAFFIGALGSRRTHERRLEALRACGRTEAELARIHGPIGLDLGARTPPEIALSILAQVVASWRRR